MSERVYTEYSHIEGPRCAGPHGPYGVVLILKPRVGVHYDGEISSVLEHPMSCMQVLVLHNASTHVRMHTHVHSLTHSLIPPNQTRDIIDNNQAHTSVHRVNGPSGLWPHH